MAPDINIGNINRLMNDFLISPHKSIIDNKPKEELQCQYCDDIVEHVLLAKKWRCIKCYKGNYDASDSEV